MTNTFLSTIKIAAITALLSAAACNDTNTSEAPGETATTLNDTALNQLTPASSTVMNVEGTATVESRQIQGTDGAGGAPGSDAIAPSTNSTAGTGSVSPPNGLKNK